MAIKDIYKPKEKEESIYSSFKAANSSRMTAAGTQNAPQNNVWNAEQSTPRLQGDTYQKSKREKSPSELGEEVVRLMLEEDVPQAQRPAAAAAAVSATAPVSKSTAGNREAAQGGRLGGDTFSTVPKNNGMSTTSDWQSMAVMQELANAGANMDVVQAGFQLGNTAKQLADDTHLAPGTSLGDYLWDETKSGAWLGAEGAWNGLVDFSEAYEKGWLLTQNVEAQQQALFNDAYREQAERNNMQTKEVLDELPEYAESFRSHKAAEYAQQIDELYDAGGYLKLLGDIVSAGGQTLPMVGINLATGGTMGLPYLFVSAEGNAAAEARAGGADDDTALLYGLLSGGLEVATEKMFDGIPGMKGGWLDNWMADYAETNVGRAVLKAAKDSVGEGLEEFTSGMIQPYLAKMWNGDERDFWQTLGESAPDALYDGFVGTANGFGLSLPGNLSNIQNARIVDAALDIMDHGGTLSDAQLVKANTALQELTSSWGDPQKSKWSRNANQQWESAWNKHFGVFFPPIMTQSNPVQNNATENDVPTEGANSNAEQNINLQTEDGAKNESSNKVQSTNDTAVHVGKNTIIHNPYSSGPVPQEKANALYNNVPISDTALQAATEQIQVAMEQNGKGFKKYLKSFYRDAVGYLLNGKQVAVENALFKDRPYNVTLNTNVIEKVISDPNMSAEKLAVFSEIEDIVKNAQYLGSGEYIAHGARAKQVIRYDYFETQATIGGNEYTVSFDVEVYPDRNNYRTHRVINNLELTPKN